VELLEELTLGWNALIEVQEAVDAGLERLGRLEKDIEHNLSLEKKD